MKAKFNPYQQNLWEQWNWEWVRIYKDKEILHWKELAQNQIPKEPKQIEIPEKIIQLELEL